MMEWVTDILKTAGGLVLGALILLIPKFNDFIVKRYQLSLDKALEDKKSINERKAHITKTRFDKEFELHQELSEKVVNMVFNLAELVRTIKFDMENKEEKETVEKAWKDAVESYNEANKTTRKLAPFISKSVYELYIQLGDKCRKQLNYYAENYRVPSWVKEMEFVFARISGDMSDSDKVETEEELKANQLDISKTMDSLMSEVRTHLSDLYYLEERK